jgi:hypothetical protein
MTRIGHETAAYLHLSQYRLTAAPSLLVTLKTENETYEEEVPLFEGRMRLRLPLEITLPLIAALENGENPTLSVDGFQETLMAQDFDPLYQKLVENTPFLQNILRGFFQ